MQRMFLKILENLQESTCAIIFFNKFAGLHLVTLLKRDSRTGVLL